MTGPQSTSAAKYEQFRGAPMGAPPWHGQARARAACQVWRLDSGGYDRAGVYWGRRPRGVRLYRYELESGAGGYVDAPDRAAALDKARAARMEG